jgi:tyrosyl-tRNA synthetase
MFGLKKQKTIVDEKEIDKLLSRGIENVFPSKEFLKDKLMKGERVTLYLGIDPTGPTLHLGHVIPIIKMAEFQRLGHQIILLMGDFTAMIGDPTDKSAARKKLSHDEVMENLKEYQKQASKFISFSGPNKALLKFNSEWLGKLSFGDVLELASLMTVDQMLKRDMFQKRIEENRPIYIHEFMYPLMQGYDCVAMDVDGEIGGNDQTFNMLTGRDLMKAIKNKEKFVIATKLLVDSTGKKMGKTENNLVSLDQTPEDMFGKVMSWSDELIIPGFEIITNVPENKIEEMKVLMEKGDNPRDYKIKLAFYVVEMYYGKDKAQKALENFEKTFAKGGVPDDVIEVTVAEGTELIDVLMSEEIVASKTEFRRLMSEGAITTMTSGEKISDTDAKVKSDTYKIGKRRFIKIKVI